MAVIDSVFILPMGNAFTESANPKTSESVIKEFDEKEGVDCTSAVSKVTIDIEKLPEEAGCFTIATMKKWLLTIDEQEWDNFIGRQIFNDEL